MSIWGRDRLPRRNKVAGAPGHAEAAAETNDVPEHLRIPLSRPPLPPTEDRPNDLAKQAHWPWLRPATDDVPRS